MWPLYNLSLLNANPKGPRTPIKMVLEPKYFNINGIWALKAHYLSPWTLRVNVELTEI